jgi:hypothetical protein
VVVWHPAQASALDGNLRRRRDAASITHVCHSRD